MKNHECEEFLRSCLPRLRFRWEGFRRVRKQVCRRLGRRIGELELENLSAYKGYLYLHPAEWNVLDSLCGITISRFYRDRKVFDALSFEILPGLAKDISSRGGSGLRCWSAGCASGEEAYTLQVIWRLRVLPRLKEKLPLHVVATDISNEMLERARAGVYMPGSMKDLPAELIKGSFTCEGKSCRIIDALREDIEFREQDVRIQMPEGTFHLILCRNLVFTYFEESLQREVLEKVLQQLQPGGYLVIGIHEALPKGSPGIERYGAAPGIYRRPS